MRPWVCTNRRSWYLSIKRGFSRVVAHAACQVFSVLLLFGRTLIDRWAKCGHGREEGVIMIIDIMMLIMIYVMSHNRIKMLIMSQTQISSFAIVASRKIKETSRIVSIWLLHRYRKITARRRLKSTLPRIQQLHHPLLWDD